MTPAHLSYSAATSLVNREANAVLAEPEIKAQIADRGAFPLPSWPADFDKLISRN
jgi:hypothetical protein